MQAPLLHVYFCLMESGSHFCFNGKIVPAGKLIISADNRSFRFGDGFFETMKMVGGNIALINYHFQRLYFYDICYMKKWENLLAHLKFLIKRNPE